MEVIMSIVDRGPRALLLLSLLLGGCAQNQIFGAGGGPPDAGAMGTCKIPTDTPVFSPGAYQGGCSTSVKPDALHACPAPYASDGTVCYCADATLCGLACKTSQDCVEPYLGCDVPSGTCRPVLGCFSNAACPAGTACLHGQAQEANVCLPLGAVPDGAACGWNGDCASGVCVADDPPVCVPRCERTSDCPSGLVCAAVDTQYAGPPWQWESTASTIAAASWASVGEPTRALGCVAQAPCAGCGGDSFCDGTTCAVSCARSADCPSGGCLASGNGGRCTAAAAGCAPTEAFVNAPAGMGGPPGYCIDYVSCYADEACAPPYVCVPGLDPLAAENAGTTDPKHGAPGLCARAAP
jgi:hypothetical protein